jgi:hypothetical protein
MGNYQYLIQDLFFATAAAACMALTRPAARLAAARPPAGLISAPVLVPVAANFLAIGAFQVRPRRAAGVLSFWPTVGPQAPLLPLPRLPLPTRLALLASLGPACRACRSRRWPCSRRSRGTVASTPPRAGRSRRPRWGPRRAARAAAAADPPSPAPRRPGACTHQQPVPPPASPRANLIPKPPTYQTPAPPHQAPEETVIFLVNVAQIWISALVLNMGPPFRAPLWTNPALVTVLVGRGGSPRAAPPARPPAARAALRPPAPPSRPPRAPSVPPSASPWAPRPCSWGRSCIS